MKRDNNRKVVIHDGARGCLKSAPIQPESRTGFKIQDGWKSFWGPLES